MPKRTIHDDVQAALSRLDAEDPGLKRILKKAYGYAVFPSVGKAALLIGGAWGRGEVYERGKPIGYATIAQTTIGVQIGGDTFTEVLVFESKESLDRFKRGRTAFAANASAVLVKAGAGGSADFEKGIAVYAYSEGGMLLEAAIGGQRFHFQPADEKEMAQATSGQSEQGEAQEDEDEGGEEESGVLGKSAGMIKRMASETGDLVKDHPIAASLIGTTVLAGAGLILMRVMRSSSDGQDAESGYEEDQEEQEDDRDEEPEDRADDSGEESDEQDDQDEDETEEEEDSPHVRRSRARA